MIKKYFLPLIALTALLSMFSIGCMNGSESEKTETIPQDTAQKLKEFWDDMTTPKHIVLGYYENPWPNAGEKSGSLPSLRTSYKSLTAIAPYWYKVQGDGTLESTQVNEVYSEAKKLGLKVYPLITNKRDGTAKILGDAEIRERATDALTQLVADYDYDGLNIDFELLPPDQRNNLTAFMQSLYPKIKALNKTVIISVFPQVDIHESVSGAYDYESLSQYTDYLQIMTYDNHWSTSEPGAIAPIEWYEKNIAYAVEKSGSPKKIIVGVSAYGYDWNLKTGKAETVTYSDAVKLAATHGSDIEYDTEVEAPHFTYENHEVWFENADSTAAKLKVVNKYKPAGIAIWRLGQEQPEIWAEVDKVYRQFEKN